MQQPTDKEFESMRWHIKGTEEPVKTAFPDLYERFIEFDKRSLLANLSIDSVIRYIVYAYHIKSPFVTRKMDVEVRKEKSLQLAGFVKEGTTWSKDIRDIILNQNDTVVNMILQFLKFERNMRFSNLMVQYERYFGMQKSAMDLSSKTKNEDLNELLDLIEGEEDKVFGDPTIGNHIGALEIIEKRTYLITPEQQAGGTKAKRAAKKT